MFRNNKNSFPLWQYLNQRLFDPQQPATLNPKKYLRQYRLEHLSKCWEVEVTPDQNPNPID